jgi:predicted DNA-binding transcriptional regulator AlpA
MTRPEVTGKKIGVAVADEPDELIPDPQVWKEFGISSMTGHRWTQDPDLGFPPKIKIRDRNYRSRRALEAFKQRRIRGAA